MSMENANKNFSVLIFTSFYGLGISTVSALSVSFAAKRMNVAGYYTWVFFFAKESFKIHTCINYTVCFIPHDEKTSKELATNVQSGTLLIFDGKRYRILHFDEFDNYCPSFDSSSCHGLHSCK